MIYSVKVSAFYFCSLFQLVSNATLGSCIFLTFADALGGEVVTGLGINLSGSGSKIVHLSSTCHPILLCSVVSLKVNSAELWCGGACSIICHGAGGARPKGWWVINTATKLVMDMTARVNHESPPGGSRGRLLHEGDAAQSAMSPSRGGTPSHWLPAVTVMAPVHHCAATGSLSPHMGD